MISSNRVVDVGAWAVAVLLPFAAISPLLSTRWVSLTDDKVAFLVLIVAWLLLGRRALPTLGDWRALFPSVVFAVVCAISARLAPPDYADEALRYLSRLVAAGFVMFVGLRLGQDASRARALLWAIAIGGGVSALLGIGEAMRLAWLQPILALFKVAPTRVGGELRVSASFQYATIASMYFEMVVPLAIMLASSARRRTAWVLGTAVAAVCTANVVLSLTRAGMLTLAAVLGVLLLGAALRRRVIAGAWRAGGSAGQKSAAGNAGGARPWWGRLAPDGTAGAWGAMADASPATPLAVETSAGTAQIGAPYWRLVRRGAWGMLRAIAGARRADGSEADAGGTRASVAAPEVMADPPRAEHSAGGRARRAMGASVRRLVWAATACALVLVAGTGLLFARNPVFDLRLVTESDADWYGAVYSAPATITLQPDQTQTVDLDVRNEGRITWTTDGTHPFALGYRWLTADGNGVLDLPPAQVPLTHPVAPGDSIHLQATLDVPQLPAGTYRLDWGMLQRDVLQFYERGWADAETAVTLQGDGSAVASMPPVVPRDDEEAPWVVGRLELWGAALRLFAAHPLLGVGPDNFRHYYGAELGLEGWDERVQANNLYLEVLADLGMVGFAAFAWVFVGGVRGIARNLSHGANRAVVIGIGLALLAFLIHGVLDAFVAFTPTLLLVWMLLGLASAQKPQVSGR